MPLVRSSEPPGYPTDHQRYEVSTFDPEAERARIVAFWRSCWPPVAGPAADLGPKCDWFYLANPAGIALGCGLAERSTGRQVGLLMIAPREFRLDGQSALGGVFVEFMIAPEHRKFAPAVTLLAGAHFAALERFQLIFGIPNPRARRLLERVNDGFEFERPRMAAVLHHAPYFKRFFPNRLAVLLARKFDQWTARREQTHRKRLPEIRCEWVETLDERFDQLWGRVPLTGRCIGVRDSRFLQWRFLKQAGRNYRILGIGRSGSQDLTGYFVVELVAGVLAVRDTLHVGSPDEQTSAWFALRDAARSLGAHGITCDLQADETTLEALRLSGMRRRGETKAFVKLRAGMSDRWRNGHTWYLTAADEDI